MPKQRYRRKSIPAKESSEKCTTKRNAENRIRWLNKNIWWRTKQLESDKHNIATS